MVWADFRARQSPRFDGLGRFQSKAKPAGRLLNQVTVSKTQGTNLEMRVQTPGRFASAQPIPQLMMPAKKYRPSLPFT